MKRLLALLLLGISGWQSAHGDPIDRLVEELNARPMWINGGYPLIKLPPTATGRAVAMAAFTKLSDDKGRKFALTPDWVTIYQERKVHLEPWDFDFLAVWCKTRHGEYVVLAHSYMSQQSMRAISYESPQAEWWTRIFEVKSDESDGQVPSPP